MTRDDRLIGLRWTGRRVLLLVLIILIGIGASTWQASQVDRDMRAELLAETQRLVETLNLRHVMALSGTEDDLALPEYQRLKEQLQTVRKAFPRYRFIYLLARRPDRSVVFQVDSEPPGAEDESRPGDVYDEITEEEHGVFDLHQPLMVGPQEDRWGVWVSALVPIELPKQAPFGVVLGIDIDAADWRKRVLLQAVPPTALVTLVLLLITIIGLSLLDRRGTEVRAGGSRPLEPGLVLAFGLVLTLYLAYVVQTESLRGQARTFALLAEARTEAIGHRLRDLRDFELEGLARFFQASDYISVEEFAHYTKFLSQDDLVRYWAWAPLVPASSRADFERLVEADGLSAYRVWESDASGGQRPVLARARYFPISRVSSEGTGAPMLGYDLASDPRLNLVVEQVLSSGLVGASDLLPSLLTPGSAVEMLVMRSPRADAGLGLAPGIVATALNFSDVLAAGAADEMLSMELVKLRSDGPGEVLDRSSSEGDALKHRLAISRPILVFGETLLVTAVATPTFLSAHRLVAGLGTAVAGLLLTLMFAMTVSLVVRRRDSLERAVRERTAALSSSEARFRELAEEARSFRWTVDRNGLYTDVDPMVTEILGYRPEELIGQKYFYDLTPESDREIVRRIGMEYIRDGLRHSGYENQVLARDGRLLWVITTTVPLLNDNGQVAGAAGSDTDITARKDAELQFETLFQEMLDGFALHEIICDEQGRPVDYRYLAINPAFEGLTGLDARSVIGRSVLEILPGTERHWIDTFGRVALSGEPVNFENHSAELGRYFDVRAFSPGRGQFACIFRDITTQKEHQQQLEYLAQHDLLTGLPNRALLADRMQQAMSQADRRNELLAVACVDLDAFKPINDHYGHEVGDRLLVTLARRMREALREGDTVARLGGDEFALVLVGLQSIEACQPLLQRVLDAVAEPVDEKGLMLQVSVSLGVTFYPQSETLDADQLLRQADQAMYQAKLAGKNRYHLFDAVHDRRLRDSHQNIERARQGLLADEFVLFYQPKVDMQQGCVIGFEALIRWQHPERGLLSPGAFLPMLEKNRLMIDLGDWVIDQVLRQITLWRQADVVLPVSLNVDPLQLAQTDFIERLKTALAGYPAVRPGDLELEVLETSALDAAVPMVDIIRAGKALGVEFALDDFGTGYSSLSYLKRLPVATLKIDGSFVRDMLQDPDDLAILQGVISLSRTFRQTVIAECVETEAHGEMLLQLGCQLGQGYAIARPMPAEDVPVWLAQWQPPASWSSIRPLDARRLPFLVAMVEYRAWTDRLRRVLSGTEADQAGLDQPAEEFIDWLEDNADVDLAAVNHCCSLHERLQAIAAELLALVRSGAGEQALARFADIETACDALLVVLQSEMQV